MVNKYTKAPPPISPLKTTGVLTHLKKDSETLQEPLSLSDLWTITGDELMKKWGLDASLIEQFMLDYGLPVRDSVTREIFNIEDKKTVFGNTWLTTSLREGPFDRFRFRTHDIQSFEIKYESLLLELKKKSITMLEPSCPHIPPEQTTAKQMEPDTHSILREDLSEKGRKGGKASKIKQPILEVTILFIKEKPERRQQSAEIICQAFKKAYNEQNRKEINVKSLDYDVYHYKGRVYCKVFHNNKTIEESISLNTFKNTYIAKAKTTITPPDL